MHKILFLGSLLLSFQVKADPSQVTQQFLIKALSGQPNACQTALRAPLDYDSHSGPCESYEIVAGCITVNPGKSGEYCKCP